MGISLIEGLPAALSDPKGPESLFFAGPKKSNPKKWPEELVGCLGYEPGRLRFVLMVCGPSLCGAAIPRAPVHDAEELLALGRLQACTITPCLDEARAQLRQRGYTATRRGVEDVPKSQVPPMLALSPQCLDASRSSGNV
jgi:hypothetical protein